MRLSSGKALAAIVIFSLGPPASADVIADWNENAVSFWRNAQYRTAARRADHCNGPPRHVRRR